MNVVLCNQLALERKQAINVKSTPATTKKKKRKCDKATTSDRTDSVVSSAEAGGDAEFVPHDYVKANLTTLLQGTLFWCFVDKCPGLVSK